MESQNFYEVYLIYMILKILDNHLQELQNLAKPLIKLPSVVLTAVINALSKYTVYFVKKNGKRFKSHMNGV